MIALVAAFVTLTVALILNARQTHLSRSEQRESEARIIAAVSPVESAADANVRVLGGMGRSANR